MSGVSRRPLPKRQIPGSPARLPFRAAWYSRNLSGLRGQTLGVAPVALCDSGANVGSGQAIDPAAISLLLPAAHFGAGKGAAQKLGLSRR